MGEVKFETIDNIGLITIHNEEKRNAFTKAMCFDLHKIYDQAEADRAIRCLIITGSGNKAFSSGHDVNEYLEDPGSFINEKADSAFWRAAYLKKPVLAAVNGIAYAAGFQLALNSDIRVVSPNARFCITGPRFGLMVIGGQSAKLPFAMPIGKAMEMLLTNEPLGAEDSVKLGFASAMFSESELLDKTINMAKIICKHSPIVVSKIKEGVNLALESGMYSAFRFELAIAKAYRNHPDSVEGIRSFLDKREPKFQPLD